jgi:hypothetical protein
MSLPIYEHTIKAYVGEKVGLYVFVTSTLHVKEWSSPFPWRFILWRQPLLHCRLGDLRVTLYGCEKSLFNPAGI